MKELSATRRIKTCCGWQDRAIITTKDGRHVTDMSYDTFTNLFDVRMADGETVTFKVLVMKQNQILAT